MPSKKKYIYIKEKRKEIRKNWVILYAEEMILEAGSGSKARPRYRWRKAPDQLADVEQSDTTRYDKNGNSSLRICSDPRVSTRVALAHSFAN